MHVSMYVCMYVYLYTIHTHTHIYIYICEKGLWGLFGHSAINSFNYFNSAALAPN